MEEDHTQQHSNLCVPAFRFSTRAWLRWSPPERSNSASKHMYVVPWFLLFTLRTFVLRSPSCSVICEIIERGGISTAMSNEFAILSSKLPIWFCYIRERHRLLKYECSHEKRTREPVRCWCGAAERGAVERAWERSIYTKASEVPSCFKCLWILVHSDIASENDGWC